MFIWKQMLQFKSIWTVTVLSVSARMLKSDPNAADETPLFEEWTQKLNSRNSYHSNGSFSPLETSLGNLGQVNRFWLF